MKPMFGRAPRAAVVWGLALLASALVACGGGGGGGGEEPPVVDTTPPSVPQNVSAAVSGSSITVTWDGASDDTGIDHYVIARTGGTQGLVVATVAVTTFTASGLPPATTYSFTVTAYDAAGNSSGASAPAIGTTDPEPPTPPDNSAIVYYAAPDSWATVNLHYGIGDTWVSPPGVAMQRVCAGWAKKELELGTATTFLADFNDGITWDDNGGSYYTLPAGTSTVSGGVVTAGASNPCPGVDSTPPTVPQGVAVTANGTSGITVTWAASTDDTGVDHYEITRTGGTQGTVVGTATATTFTATGLTAATTYSFTVRAHDAAGNASEASSPAITTTDPEPPPPPNTATVYYAPASGWTTVNIHYGIAGVWTTPPGIAMQQACAGWWLKQIDLGTNTSFKVTFNNGTAWDNNGGQDYTVGAGVTTVSNRVVTSNAASPCGVDDTPPSTPLNVTATPSGTSVTVTWSASTDDHAVSGYEVTRTGGSQGTVVGTASTTTFSVSSLSPSTTYTFTVKAVDTSSNKSAASAAAQATTGDGSAVYPDRLGALYLPAATKFRLWSPDSSSVTVTVGGTTYPMVHVADFAGYTSIYEATVSGDLELQPYQFAVGGAAVRDPYALMVNPGTTQGVVMDMASIAPAGGWAATPALVNREDAIIYETHVRDFTIDANSGVDAARKGKFLGMVQTGTTYGTAKTGLDHLKELGVTHVQLMPVYDFGTALYNWGYDPVNYNVPEEQYAQATDPVGRVQEFQTMVNELHKNGLRVVVDVVYNHTYDKTVLQLITGKYYTTVDLSGVGNSIDDGNPMVARMIQDSLEQWVRNYNVDGFRFDLLGVFYATNAAAWGNHLNATFPTRNLLLYGEPWNGYATDPNDAQKVRFGKMPTLAGAHVGVFNGGYRDDLRGPGDSAVQRYVVNQAPSWWGAIAAGSRGSITATKSTSALPNAWDSMFAYDPEQAINYVSAHDNLNMWDKINYAGLSGGPTGYAGRVDRFTIGILMTSQGIPFFYEGDEMLHSKAYGGDYTTAKNSYRAGDNYNAIRWADKVTNAATHQFYRDAIALRRANPALRLTSWDEINTRVRTTLNAGSQSASSINAVHDASLPAGVVVNSIDADGNVGNGHELVVVYNNGNSFNLTLPAGSWTKIFDAGGAVSKTDVVCEGTAVTVFRKN
ncbi:MAG: carbohydrate binding domain-containing protein [Anaeromyxobacter sp.]